MTATDDRFTDQGRLDQAYHAALWWKGIRETNNETFLPLFADEHRYLVLMGGGGSGKSIFAGRKIVERCSSEPGHRWLVCRKVARTLRESCFKQLKSQVHEFCEPQLEKINEGDMLIRFRNGSEILFAGLDDVEKLKSIYNITGIWIEEASEILESDFNQLDIRLRGQTRYYKQIIVTFNPISMLHWLKRRFFDTPDERVRTHHSTYRDNRFLDDEAKRVLESYRDTDPYYYMVYCLGQWGITGKSVFDGKKLQDRLTHLTKPVAVGVFEYDYDGLCLTNIRFHDDPDGYIQVYEKPLDGHPYVIGGDTAGEGSDKFVGQVLDNSTGRQAAKLRHTFDEDLYARQMYCLGRWYHDAMLAIEVNYSTYPQKELERLGYKRFYVREAEDTYTGKLKSAFGFRTQENTRTPAIANLVRIFRENPELVRDRDTLEEMSTFVRNEAGRAEAQDGAHDDCVMALAIAYYTRGQQRATVTKPKAQRVRWAKDQIEDYERADAQTRKLLVQMWGEPL